MCDGLSGFPCNCCRAVLHHGASLQPCTQTCATVTNTCKYDTHAFSFALCFVIACSSWVSCSKPLQCSKKLLQHLWCKWAHWRDNTHPFDFFNFFRASFNVLLPWTTNYNTHDNALCRWKAGSTSAVPLPLGPSQPPPACRCLNSLLPLPLPQLQLLMLLLLLLPPLLSPLWARSGPASRPLSLLRGRGASWMLGRPRRSSMPGAG